MFPSADMILGQAKTTGTGVRRGLEVKVVLAAGRPAADKEPSPCRSLEDFSSWSTLMCCCPPCEDRVRLAAVVLHVVVLQHQTHRVFPQRNSEGLVGGPAHRHPDLVLDPNNSQVCSLSVTQRQHSHINTTLSKSLRSSNMKRTAGKGQLTYHRKYAHG